MSPPFIIYNIFNFNNEIYLFKLIKYHHVPSSLLSNVIKPKDEDTLVEELELYNKSINKIKL